MDKMTDKEAQDFGEFMDKEIDAFIRKMKDMAEEQAAKHNGRSDWVYLPMLCSLVEKLFKEVSRTNYTVCDGKLMPSTVLFAQTQLPKWIGTYNNSQLYLETLQKDKPHG